ncbi:hypothetical protein ACIBCR_29150 [Micromonospora echinospora]|uniref:hypothetical protein n=1 Tax=Micromonospora echinospora TaxID=1877 RepID=UPI00378DB683
MNRSMVDDGPRNNGLLPVLAEMLGSASVGLDLVEAAGELAAENARFNAWVLTKKADLTSVDLWNLASLSGKILSDSNQIWTDFLSAEGSVKEAKYRELVELLHAQRTQLWEVRSSNVITFCDPGMPPELLDL